MSRATGVITAGRLPLSSRHLHAKERPSNCKAGRLFAILVRKDGTKLTAMAVQFEFFPDVGGNSILYLKQHLKSIHKLEQLTGLDFFSALPDSVEQDLEAAKAPTIW